MILKLLSITREHDQIQADLDTIGNWVIENKMDIAMDKCTKTFFRGAKPIFYFQNEVVINSDVVKNLGIHINESLSSEMHPEDRNKKANSVLYLRADYFPENRNKSNTRSPKVRNFCSTSQRPSLLCAHKNKFNVLGKFQKSG